MTETEHVLCKWRKQWWPAKVLSRSQISRGRAASKAKVPFIRVEIMRLNEQVDVCCSDVRPLKEESIEDIASKLDHSERRSPTKELTYRRALREALDILHGALPSVDGIVAKGRHGGAQILRDRPLVATRQEISSCNDPHQGEKSDVAPPLSTFGAPVRKRNCSTKTTRASADGAPSLPESRGLSANGKLSGSRRGVSKAKRPGTPSEEGKPSPEHRMARRSLCSVEEDRVTGTPVKKRACPSAALKHFVQTSTPVRPSRESSSQPASEGEKPGALPSPQKTPRISSSEPPGLASFFSEEKASPANKLVNFVNGRSPPNRADGARGGRNDGDSPPSRKRRRKLCLENLNPEPRLEESVLGGETGGSRSLQAEELQAEPLKEEDEEGGDSTSDLSLRLSPIKEPSLSPALREDDEEDELPSILPPQDPGSIEAGKLVWCKLPRYPYWPAVVKKVTRKSRKANVFLIEKSMEEKSKGFSISLRKLKPFDSPEKQQLIGGAREDYYHEINWCINLIEDYRIRVGCCSFTGSFLEYCTDAMSYPVRKEAPLNLSQMNFPQVNEGDFQAGSTPAKVAKKVLPDRTRASRDRANRKIVDFIVKAKGADDHLWSVLKHEKPSRWLAQSLQARPSVTTIETYLEDDAQQDLVFNYLQGVYRKADPKTFPLVNGDWVKFILDVLFPEAIIYAISAIDRIDYRKAEQKYINGPLVSQREREKFEEEILEQKKRQQMERTSPEDGL